jgi:hypothetical protein
LGTGLAPDGDRLLLQQQAARVRGSIQGAQAAQQALQMIETEIARLLAEEDRIKATGAPLSRGRSQQVAAQRKSLERRANALRKALQPTTEVGETLAPWQRRPQVVQTRGIQPMRAVPTAPAVGRPVVSAAVAGLGEALINSDLVPWGSLTTHPLFRSNQVNSEIRKINEKIDQLESKATHLQATKAFLWQFRVPVLRKQIQALSQKLKTEYGVHRLPSWAPHTPVRISVQPIPSATPGVQGLGDILGIPTWALLAAGGAGALILFKKFRKARR